MADPVWIEECPEVEIIDDVAHIREKSGNAVFHMAMRPNTLLATAQVALRVFREWEKRQAASPT